MFVQQCTGIEASCWDQVSMLMQPLCLQSFPKQYRTNVGKFAAVVGLKGRICPTLNLSRLNVPVHLPPVLISHPRIQTYFFFASVRGRLWHSLAKE